MSFIAPRRATLAYRWLSAALNLQPALVDFRPPAFASLSGQLFCAVTGIAEQNGVTNTCLTLTGCACRISGGGPRTPLGDKLDCVERTSVAALLEAHANAVRRGDRTG